MLKGFVSGEEKDIVRIPMKVGNEYKEGWEVRDSQDRLIWGREDELQTATATLPFKGYALPVKVKSLLGNAVQNGTPAPDNIITPEMCGVRTGNFIPAIRSANGWVIGYRNSSNGSYSSNNWNGEWLSPKIPLTAGEKITISAPQTQDASMSVYFWNGSTYLTHDSNTDYNGSTFTAPAGTTQIDFALRAGVNNKTEANVIANGFWVMLNLGSTALPYEPYGWKVPFENHGENLFDMTTVKDGKNISMDGSITNYAKRCSTVTPIDVSTYSNVTLAFTATLSRTRVIYALFNDSTLVTRQTAVSSGSTIDVSSGNKLYICFYDPADTETIQKSDLSNVMLSAGSQALPYSPYLNATVPVYLGEVPTVRRVRKLVLTGEEAFDSSYSGNNKFFYTNIATSGRETTVYSSHFVFANIGSTTTDVGIRLSSGTSLRIRPENVASMTTTDFKQFLSDEYSAGHPVTVWYALSTPETTISNEALCKISTYADELTTIQVHGLSAPLYGIGDYKDTLNLSTGVVTRKVKKLVFDGSETWMLSGNIIYINNTDTEPLSPLICTHFPNATNTGMWNGNNWVFQVDISKFGMTGRNAWIAYLQQQYQAGTPVTVWYVLDTPETETVTVPRGMTGEIEGYLTQVSTPSPTNRSVPKWNGVEESGGTYAVTVYTPPEIPTTTGQNTLTVDSNLAPSSLTVKGHIKELT